MANKIPADSMVASTSPFRARVHKVGSKQFRIRIPRSVTSGATWLTTKVGDITVCVATIGPFGGLVLSPTERDIGTMEKLVNDTLGRHPATVHDVGAEWVKLARFVASTWHVRIGCESRTKYSITLPEATRNLGVFPQDEQYLVVFPAGGVIEVWPALEWKNHLRQLAQGLSKLVASASEEVADQFD